MRSYLCEENRRKDEIIMQQAVTVRQLTVPQEPRESPTEPAEGPEGSEPRPATEGPPEPPQRSWWRRWFGFE